MPTYESVFTKSAVDPETGEIQEMETKKRFSYRLSDVDEFYMVFYNCIAVMHKIKSKKTLSLLHELCKHAQFNTGIVEVSANVRRTVCKDADVNITNFSKHINVLKEAGLIKDRGGCSYIINPQAIWKGDLKQRDKMLKDRTFYIEFGIK